MTEVDHSRVTAVVDAGYETLTFGPGEQPDWDRFFARYVDGAVVAHRVFPEDASITVMSVAEYAHKQMRADITQHGYSETPGRRETFVVGSAAMVRQEFTMNLPNRPPVYAVDMFSLVEIDGQWRIVSVISDLISSTLT